MHYQNQQRKKFKIKFQALLKFAQILLDKFHVFNLLYVTSPQKQVTGVSLVLKDSDMDSETSVR